MLADFEVIEIVDDSNPYPMLLGIYWAFDMNGVINLKNPTMSFERKSLRLVAPLEPAEGHDILNRFVTMKTVMMTWIRSMK